MYNRFRDYLKPNYADKPSKGLYEVKRGDVVEIGVQGSREKREIKIVEILKSGKLKDADGNIFNRNGMIYRGTRHWSQNAKENNTKIYAVPLTKEKKTKNILTIGQNMLARHIQDNKDKLTKEQIQEICKILNVHFSNLDEKI